MKRLVLAGVVLLSLSACADPPSLPRVADARCPSGERFVRPHSILHAGDGLRAHPDDRECAPVRDPAPAAH